ncbi:hypothetical protein CBR_g39306 [Chara braunii]|uniref:CCHC-type domain-containing protein n=1 Tax=Chara braunii TaxID=69332 RepID=A0A388K137_CHABU|nr:hypothetical protein CBR_g39306 [Chara braunii]|eukprot:GBG63762.1 hypothetical protein CBR_g39306 [Chara braunii]
MTKRLGLSFFGLGGIRWLVIEFYRYLSDFDHLVPGAGDWCWELGGSIADWPGLFPRMATPFKCYTCGGEGHFARECPSKPNGGGGNTNGGSQATTPVTPRFWTPRRNQVDEEEEFLRELINERKEERAKGKELEDQRRFDERLRTEVAKYTEATKAEVMAEIGRQYRGHREDLRREEQIRGWSSPPARRGLHMGCDEVDLGTDDLDEEIRRLSTLREKRRKGKEPVGTRRFRQPAFSEPGDDGDGTPARAETSRRAEARARTKIPAGSGADGFLQFILDQKKELKTMRIDELKCICTKECVRYCTKGPSIDRIIEARTKLAYDGFVFSLATSAPGSPEVDLAN